MEPVTLASIARDVDHLEGDASLAQKELGADAVGADERGVDSYGGHVPSASTRRGTSRSGTEQRATRNAPLAVGAGFCGTTNTPRSRMRSARPSGSSVKTVTKKPPS